MLTDDERRHGAQLLLDAQRQRKVIPQLSKVIPQLSKTFPGIEIVDAYRIQDLWAEMKMALVHRFHETDLLSGIHCFFAGL